MFRSLRPVISLGVSAELASANVNKQHRVYSAPCFENMATKEKKNPKD